jgi:uncharacterized protein (TIGR02118 family)
MFKLSVFYPNTPGATFDMDYYVNTHMPLVKRLVGDAVTGTGADSGLAGGAPGAPAAFIAIGHVYFDNVDAFQAAFAPHAPQIVADLANFTNVEPTMQFSAISLAP